MKTIIIILISILTGNVLFAQDSKLVTAGTIEYEKSVNMFAVAREMLKSMQTNSMVSIYEQAFEQYQKNRPQFGVVKNTLTFSDNKTLFTPGSTDNVALFMGSSQAITAYNNTVYTDLSASKRIVKKSILSENYLLTDSLSKIKWKIIGGSEDVAGYACREAHGVVQDSIYIVAFFTDKIRVNGGPESFSSLPGMILKLVLPREHITYTATKVTVELAATKPIVPPAKGKPIDRKQLADLVKRYGTYAKFFVL